MKTRAIPRTAPLASFTLVEIMVSMVILSIMLIGLATMMAYVTRAWLNALGALDNFTKARVMLTLQDRDIQMMVLRPDLGSFVGTNSTPACSFYTKVEGNEGMTTNDTRSISLVQYYVTTNATTTPYIPAYTLVRSAYGVGFPPTTATAWSTNATTNQPPWFTSVGNTNTMSQLASVSPTTQSESLAAGVIAFQWQFIDGNGAIWTPPYLPTGYTGTNTSLPFYFNFVKPNSPTNPRIVVVSMVVLSNIAYKLASQTGAITNVVADFPATLPTSATNQTYSQYWNSIYSSSTNFGSNLPEPVRHGIQIFERHIPLPITTPAY